MKFITKATHFLSANKSSILFTLGIGFGIGCVVETAIQTVKACDIVEESNIDLDEAEKNFKDDNLEKELKSIRKKTNIKLAKNYIIPVGLGISSVACLLCAYKILSSEKAAALAALSSVSAAFEKYRSRVIDKYGVEVDYELYNGEPHTTVSSVDGDEDHKLTQTIRNPIDDNCYTKIFSYETSGEWKSTPKLNKAFLKFYERYWNEQLRNKGYVTYNEVIETLGFSRKVGDDMTERFIPNGIGWVSAENIPEGMETMYDPFISFYSEDFNDDLDAVYEDLGYVLRFNCYPIDNLLLKRDEKFNSGNTYT